MRATRTFRRAPRPRIAARWRRGPVDLLALAVVLATVLTQLLAWPIHQVCESGDCSTEQPSVQAAGASSDETGTGASHAAIGAGALHDRNTCSVCLGLMAARSGWTPVDAPSLIVRSVAFMTLDPSVIPPVDGAVTGPRSSRGPPRA